MTAPDLLADPPPFLRALVDSSGTFQPAADPDDGVTLAVVPVRDWRGETFDLVGWQLGAQRQWWTMQGLGVVLGEHVLWRAGWTGDAVKLTPTPAAWLREPAASVCVLDWRGVSLRSLFGDVASVVPATVEIEKLLRKRLAEEVRPSFEIRRAAA